MGILYRGCLKVETDRLEEAIAYGHGEFDIEDILGMIESGRMQLYYIEEDDTYIVTEIVRYPKKTRLRVVLTVGTLNRHTFDFVESIAKAFELDGIEGLGRVGWVRALEPYGFKPGYTSVIKDFNEEAVL